MILPKKFEYSRLTRLTIKKEINNKKTIKLLLDVYIYLSAFFPFQLNLFDDWLILISSKVQQSHLKRCWNIRMDINQDLQEKLDFKSNRWWSYLRTPIFLLNQLANIFYKHLIIYCTERHFDEQCPTVAPQRFSKNIVLQTWEKV